MNNKSLLQNAYKDFNKEDAEIDLDILFCHALGVPRNRLFMHLTDETTENVAQTFSDFVKRYKNGEPVQYITGVAPFGELEFSVTPDVLIPRFDTEILWEACVNLLKPRQSFTCLDMCTGSGCLAISIKNSLPHGKIFASDISPKALAIAKKNSDNILGQNAITFFEGNLFESLNPQEDFYSFFDMIVSNPPYIPSNDVLKLDPVVKDREPRLALDGGDSGLEFYHRIATDAKKYLKEKGCLCLEYGIGQSADIKHILEDKGYYNIDIIKDYGGIDRVITANI